LTAEELLDELDDACGPCTRICISCPEGAILKDIRDVIIALKTERDKYKAMVDLANEWGEWMQLCEKYHIDWQK